MVSIRARNGLSIIQGAWAAALLGVALLAGCGGSNDEAAAAPPATTVTSAAAGTVTGFSANWVLVNGIKYDKSAAKVLNDDDEAVSGAALKLGMQVDIQANGLNRARGVARAASIAFSAAVVGPVDAVDVAAGQITVLGQTIQVSDGTVFDADLVGGIDGVTVGAILSVHGLLDAASGVTSATRVDLLDAARVFRLRGVVSELNATDKTLKIGGQAVSFANAGANKVPANLADGQVVRAVLETAQVNGQFVARRIRADKGFVADGNAVDIESFVTQFTSATSFKIFGLPVDASNATFVNEASLKRGARVRVQGALAGGVLVATSVEVKLRGQKNVVELQGAVAALDAAKKTFTLNDVTVDFSGKVTFVGGAEADLVDGVNVIVKGKLTAGGTKLKAQSIEIVAAVALDERQGAVSALNADLKTFKLNAGTADEVTVDFSGQVTFVGDAAALIDGVNVLAKGKLSADGLTLVAQSIEILAAAP